MSLVVVCGLRAEAAIAAGPGVRCVVGGGDVGRLRERLEAELARGAPAGVLSFGVAGALAQGVRTGELHVAAAIVDDGGVHKTDPPWRQALVERLQGRETRGASSAQVVARSADKAALFAATGAAWVDMESGIVADACRSHRLPFAVVRAISDGASTTLPPSAIAGMGADGEVRIGAVVRALAARPHDLPGLLQAARDSAAAFQALRRARARLGPGFALGSIEP